MHNIQRYLLRDDRIGDFFGEHEEIETGDFKWFTGTGENIRLGIGEVHSAEVEYFLSGILVAGDEFVVDFKGDFTHIYRNDFSSRSKLGIVGSDENKLKGINLLVGMLRGGEVAAYLSSRQVGIRPEIVTFSRTKPSSNLYTPPKRMIVKEIR